MAGTYLPSLISAADLGGTKPLFLFALLSEAAGEFDDCHTLITGIGKVNATYALTQEINRHRPGLIVNLGSAGSRVYKRGEVVCCTRFIQRDMDITGLGYRPYETPFSDVEPILHYGLTWEGLPEASCGTGDNFEMNHRSRDYEVVDMEAYALALVAMKSSIPFLCLKYISDGADGSAAEDWTELVHHAAQALRRVLFATS